MQREDAALQDELAHSLRNKVHVSMLTYAYVCSHMLTYAHVYYYEHRTNWNTASAIRCTLSDS